MSSRTYTQGEVDELVAARLVLPRKKPRFKSEARKGVSKLCKGWFVDEHRSSIDLCSKQSQSREVGETMEEGTRSTDLRSLPDRCGDVISPADWNPIPSLCLSTVV